MRERRDTTYIQACNTVLQEEGTLLKKAGGTAKTCKASTSRVPAALTVL